MLRIVLICVFTVFGLPEIHKYGLSLQQKTGLPAPEAVVKRAPEARESRSEAVFAGGAFIFAEAAFKNVPGVTSVTPGFAAPEYASSGGKAASLLASVTRREERFQAVRVTFDRNIISYRDLLRVYWNHIDPTDGEGQFADRGAAFSPAIFYNDDIQHMQARLSLHEIRDVFGKHTAARILPAGRFTPAPEEYVRFSEKYPGEYAKRYRHAGRGAALAAIRKAINGAS